MFLGRSFGTSTEQPKTNAQELFFCRNSVLGEHKDYGFNVLSWGNLEHDVHATIKQPQWEASRVAQELTQEQHGRHTDIVPSGWESQRTLTLLGDNGVKNAYVLSCRTQANHSLNRQNI